MFPTMRDQIDRDLKKYQAKCERNRINGAKGGKANATERKRTPPKEKEKTKEKIEGVPGGTPAGKPPKTRAFVPPSVEEVRAYCLERGNGIDSQYFVDYYDARGWMIGKNKMKDWRAAGRTRGRKNNRGVEREGGTPSGDVNGPHDTDAPARGIG